MLLTFVILAITVILFVWGRIRSDLVALMAMLALFLIGILDLEQALAGFSDPTVILIAALFVVGEGLSKTGVTAWIGQKMLEVAGNSVRRLLIVTMGGTAGLSGFVSNTGTVATLLPAVVAAAWRINSVPSRFLIPLAFAANVGGLLTLTGSPPNIIVADALSAQGLQAFGYFEFALIGLPLLLMVVVFLVLFGERLLPAHNADERPPDLGRSVAELADTYALEERLYRLRVRRQSPLGGQTLAEARLGADFGVAVVRVEHPDNGDVLPYLSPLERRRQRVRETVEALQESAAPVPGAGTVVRPDDVLLVRGPRENVERLMTHYNLGLQEPGQKDGELTGVLLSQEIGLAEVLVTPRSAYIGQTIIAGQFARKFNVQVLSIRRGDRPLDRENERLRFGDSLLVRGRWEDIEGLRKESRNFVVVGSPEALSRQIVQLTPQAVLAVVALLGMVVLMVTGIVPVVVAALLAAVAMVLGGALRMSDAYRTINWSSVVLIAAMIPMSTALVVTGGAQYLADLLVGTLGSIGPYALLAGIFLLTTAFSQVMSNTATTILMAPIVLAAGQQMGLSPYPLLMIVAVSASTAFMTPIGTTTNLMVFGPGGYRFQDYVRIGFPLVLLSLLIGLVLVPVIWPL